MKSREIMEEEFGRTLYKDDTKLLFELLLDIRGLLLSSHNRTYANSEGKN